MQNIKRLLQEYEVAKQDSFYLKLWIFFEKNIINILNFFLSILFISFILIGIFDSFQKSFGINFLILCAIFQIGIIFTLSAKISNIVFGKAERIKRKISAQKYVGDIYDIFDKECSITIDLLRKYKKDLEKDIYESKGLRGTLILLLMNLISEEREKQIKDKLSMEEKEALIIGETKIGNMLKTLENL